jgi:hypothetical protein
MMARRNTGPTWKVRELVRERDRERCASCGISIYDARTWSWHHRRNRGQGGSSDPAINSPANLLLLCGDGTTGCHGYITAHPAEARAAGRSVSLNARVDPVDVPVMHAVHGLVLLDHEGGFTHTAEHPGTDRLIADLRKPAAAAATATAETTPTT